MNTDTTVFAFACGVKGTEWTRTVNARTRGRAKSMYWREIQDPWPDVPFTAITSHKVGQPRTSEDDLRCFSYRGLPQLRCGHLVRTKSGHSGTVVGHDASANVRVLFDENSRYKGQTLSVHPDEMDVLARTGQRHTHEEAQCQQ